MSSTGNNPDINPANLDTLIGTLRSAFSKLMQNTDGMLPARIVAYDRTTNRAQVQPLIQLITTDNSKVSRAQIASVPVFQIGAGGFMLNFPLKTGDLGWIIANDRDVSLFLQSYNETQPNTYRVKTFSDSVFFPDAMRNYTIAGEDEENAVFQNLDCTIKISLWSDRIKLTAPLVEITGGLQVDGVITGVGLNPLTISSHIISTGGITVSGGGANSLTVNGNERVNGNITASGSITPGVP